MQSTYQFRNNNQIDMKLEIISDAKCKHCKWFDYHYKGKRKAHKCNLTEEVLTLKSKICDKFELGW